MSLTTDELKQALDDAWDALDWTVDLRTAGGDAQEWIDNDRKAKAVMERLRAAIETNPALAEAIIEALKDDR